MIITITPADVKNAKEYESNTDCYLATALKRLGYTDVYVTGWDFRARTPKGKIRYFGIVNWDDILYANPKGNTDIKVLEVEKRATTFKNYREGEIKTFMMG